MKQALRIVALAILIGPSALAAEEAQELSWGMLMPGWTPPEAKSNEASANAQPPLAPGTASSASIPTAPLDSSDAPWMSRGTRQRDRVAWSAVVPELNGQHVRIGGYVVPLDFEGMQVKEFLLVPFVGACIHVPAPPPNQIIYVKAANAFQAKGPFDAVYVIGTISTAPRQTGLAATGYTIEAEKIEDR